MAHINHIVSMVEDTEDLADSPSSSHHDDQPSPPHPPPPTGNNSLALFQPPPPSNPHSPIPYPPLNTPLGSPTHVDDSIKGEKYKGVVVYAYNYDDDDDDDDQPDTNDEYGFLDMEFMSRVCLIVLIIQKLLLMWRFLKVLIVLLS